MPRRLHGDKRKDTAEVIIPRKQVAGLRTTSVSSGRKTVRCCIISDFDKTHGYGDAWVKEIIGLATEAKAMRIVKKLDLEQIGARNFRTARSGSNSLREVSNAQKIVTIDIDKEAGTFPWIPKGSTARAARPSTRRSSHGHGHQGNHQA